MDVRSYLRFLAVVLVITTQSALLLVTRRMPPSRARTWVRRSAWASVVFALLLLVVLVLSLQVPEL